MKLNLNVSKQPDDESCGITCLQAIYDYYSHPTSLEKLKTEIEHWQTGGTVAVNLARHALGHGFQAEIHSYNIKIFDPSWSALNARDLSLKLKQRQRRIRSTKQKKVIGFYLDFLKQGGSLKFDDLDENLLTRLFKAHHPIICGLSATYLYQQVRETADCTEDDVVGQPVGHFVVVSGWDPQTRTVTINDPLRKNPISDTGTYKLPFTKFSNAVMLGILTYDENLLVISKQQ
ncbi:MAG: cysteine peptidase family C39 domain-containing protein [Fibrobacteria bacterium]